jgi:hypothetical protein
VANRSTIGYILFYKVLKLSFKIYLALTSPIKIKSSMHGKEGKRERERERERESLAPLHSIFSAKLRPSHQEERVVLQIWIRKNSSKK